MLSRLAQTARSYAGARPLITNVYGLARSLLAIATAATLASTHSAHLFVLAADQPSAPKCGPLGRFELFCALHDHLELARWLSVVLLLIVASGYRPRFTGIVHWWVAFSFHANVTVVEGGDQLAAVLTLLLVPVTLLDARRFHWDTPRETGEATNIVAKSAFSVIRLQVSLLYLEAAVAKMPVVEWHNGTALYYWFQDPFFGAPPWLAPAVRWLIMSEAPLALLTWSVIALELLLAASLVMPERSFRTMRTAGLLLHLGIALVHGLPSFSTIMAAALVLYLTPFGTTFDLRVPSLVRGWAARSKRSALGAPARA